MNAYEIHVHWPLKARTASGGCFMDLCGRGYDVEAYTSRKLADDRIASLRKDGIRAKFAKRREATDG